MHRQNKNNFGVEISDGFMGSDEDAITQNFLNLGRQQKQNQAEKRKNVGIQQHIMENNYINPDLTTPRQNSERNIFAKPGQNLNNESFLSGTSVSTNMSKVEAKQAIKNEPRQRNLSNACPVDNYCLPPQLHAPKSKPQLQLKQEYVQKSPNHGYCSREPYEQEDYQQEDQDEYYHSTTPQQRYCNYNQQIPKLRPQMQPKQKVPQRNLTFGHYGQEQYEQEQYQQGYQHQYYQQNIPQRNMNAPRNGPPQQRYQPQPRQYIPNHTDFRYPNEEQQYQEEYDQEDRYDRYGRNDRGRNQRMTTHSRSRSRQGRSGSQKQRHFQQPYNVYQYETAPQNTSHSRNSSRTRTPQQRYQPHSRQYIPSNTDFGYSDEEDQGYYDEPYQRNQGRRASKRVQPRQKPSISKKHRQPQQHKTIKVLVIGATGAGKSSLINLFYVWSQNWTIEDFASSPKKVAIRTAFLDGDGEAETNVGNQAVSQTTKAKLYNFDLFNEETGIEYTLNFMDTPGLGDTLGIERDDKHLELVMDAVGNTDGLNAILLVMNGADPRINARVKYIMAKLQGMIPDTLYSNLVVLLTNVGLSPNLKIQDVLDFHISDENVFFYNNEIFALCPSKFNNHNVKRKLEQSYRDSINTLSDLLNKISSCSVKPTKEFILIKEARDDLKKKLVECNDADAKIYKKKKELQRLATDIADGKIKIDDLHKQLNQTVEEETWESQPTPSHNTTCLTCKHCCHENCQLDETTEEGSSYFQNCLAFNGETCHECGHSYTSHVHLRIKYVKKVNQVSVVDPNVQIAITKAKNDADAKDKAHNAIDAEIKKLDAQLKKSQGDIMQLVKKMQKVCSRFDYIREIEACINVLDEQIDAATSDFSKTLNRNHATTLDGLQKTRAKMEKLRNDLVKHLHNPQAIY